ncbi:MAG: glycosyltransferase family 2 protein [Mediterranea massiliensis]|nr:glycosyltransferase family 2 protein [Mediterranea massiliensis]
MKKISIIVPCYNVEQYLWRCYKSFAHQKDAEDVELIFINDGSTDNTLAILQEIKSLDDRVILLNQENLGVSAARNTALNIVQGEYIYLLDADDYLTEGAISRFKQIILEYFPDIIMTAYNVSKGEIETLRKLPVNDGLYDKFALFGNISFFPTAPKLAYRSKIIKEHNIRFMPSIKCGEVYAFTVNYIQFAMNIYTINIPAFYYFMRSDSAIHKPNYQNDQTIMYALDSIYENGEDLTSCKAFPVTAFRLFRTFAYTKFLKYSLENQMLSTIKEVLSNISVKKCIKDTAFKPHKMLKERLLALYICLMPKELGFKLLIRLVKK